MTEAERVVLQACREANVCSVTRPRCGACSGKGCPSCNGVGHYFDGFNALLVWSLIPAPRPHGTLRAGAVLKRMRGLVRQGALKETRPRVFRLADD